MNIRSEDRQRLEQAGAELFDEVTGQAVASALVEQAFPWAGILHPLVLLDERTSNFPALVRAGPIAGYIVHFRHDDAPVVLCRSLEAYLEAVRSTGELPHDSLLDPRAERTEAEELAAQHLVANAFDEDDWTALALAIPLIGRNIGLLVALSEDETVGELAHERLRVVATPDERRAIATGSPPAPWPVPGELMPRMEAELSGWSRSQIGYEDAWVDGPVEVVRDGATRILVLHEAIDLTRFLDETLPDEPEGTGFLEAIGTWGTGEPVAELKWFGADHVRLTVGDDQLIDWTRE